MPAIPERSEGAREGQGEAFKEKALMCSPTQHLLCVYGVSDIASSYGCIREFPGLKKLTTQVEEGFSYWLACRVRTRKAGVFIRRLEGTGGGADTEIPETEEADRPSVRDRGKARPSGWDPTGQRKCVLMETRLEAFGHFSRGTTPVMVNL